jgi:hypothetical protein
VTTDRFELIFPPEVPFGTPHVPQTNKFYQKLMHRFFPTRGTPPLNPASLSLSLLLLTLRLFLFLQVTFDAMSCSLSTSAPGA